MPRRNRIDPWGDLHPVSSRGLLTGNRGCLVNAYGQLNVHHRGSLWISCVTEFGGRRQPLDDPHRWTPLFFLDEAVALAAGHRPCGYCRPDAYLSFRDAVALSDERDFHGALDVSPDRRTGKPSASELNRRLQSERLRPGRGLTHAADRRLWTAEIAGLPSGTVIVAGNDDAMLLGAETRQPFTFAGWGPVLARPRRGEVLVLTPPTIVAALQHGYLPLLDGTAVA